MIWLIWPLFGFAAKRIPYGGVLRAVLRYEVKTIDPVLAGNPTELQVAALVFDRLVAFDPKGDLRPALAAEWAANEQATQWDFSLRKGARFHDGSPVTTADVKSSFERLVRMSENPVGNFLSKQIKGADDYARGQRADIQGFLIKTPEQFTILTAGPQPSLPEWLALLPCSIVKRSAPGPRSEVEDAKVSTPVGSGPFVLASMDKNRIVLRAFAQYFAGPPYLERIEVSPRTLIRQPATMFRIGKLDLLELAMADRGPIERENMGAIFTSPRPVTLLLGVNPQAPYFKRAEAREAVSLAVDRNIILRVLLKSEGRLATGIIPPEICEFAMLREKQAYQPNLARRLFSGEGPPPAERTITMITRSIDDYTQPIAQRMAVNLRDLGLRAQIEPLSPEDFTQRLRNRQFDLFLDSLILPSLDSRLNLYTFLAHYATIMTPEQATEAIHFLNRGEAAADPDERAKLLYRAEKQLLDDYTLIPLFHLNGAWLASGNLSGVWLDLLGNIRLEDAWRKDER